MIGNQSSEVRYLTGPEAAREARGVVVVIDVIRAFTVAACALAGGATESILVTEVDEALKLHAQIPGSVLSAEVGGRPIPGIPISNSPTMISRMPLRGRTLVQRTSAGTRAAGAAARADSILAASLVVAGATAALLRRMRPPLVSLVASGDPLAEPEDGVCARHLGALLEGRPSDLDAALEPLRRSERFRAYRAGEVPGFPPTDLDLALAVDRFDFAMPVVREDGLLRLRALRPGDCPRPG
jgi:2-phosphosulfolactate phosphatase